MKKLLGRIWEATNGLLAVLVLFAVSGAVLYGCSELWKTDGSCDPQTAYNHCETPSGSGPGNK